MSERVMIAGDVHTHVWDAAHLSREFRDDLLRAWPEAAGLDAGYEAHAEHAALAGRSVVLAFDAEYAGLVVPDEYVAACVRRDEARLVGFCSVDPARPDFRSKLGRAVEELGLKGVKLAPTYQGFDPLSARAFELYEEIAARRLPIVWHQGTTFVRRAILAYALPVQIDQVAIRFPDLTIVIAHIGHPWIGECLAVIRKHPNVYADVSALAGRPQQLRGALIAASEYRCADKLLYGSDFPFGRIDRDLELLSGWATADDEPPELRAAARHILTTDPLATLGI